jgi:hypothetical protein
MFKPSSARIYALVAGIGLALASIGMHAQDDNGQQRGRKYKAPPPSSRIEVTVLRAADGKPIENAAVIFHPIEGDKDKGGMEVKTNGDGKAVIDVIPIGDTVRMQIIAKGYQTHGSDYKVDRDQISKEVRMNRPAKQYSTYQNNKSESGDKQKKDEDHPNKDQQQK